MEGSEKIERMKEQRKERQQAEKRMRDIRK
jgi:hypothetical protein